MRIEDRVKKMYRSSELLIKAVDLDLPRDRKWIRFIRHWAWIHLKQTLAFLLFLMIKKNEVTET